MATLSDVLGGIGAGIRETLPIAVRGVGQGLMAGYYPEEVIKQREAEKERLWKEEEQRRREAAAMAQLEKRLMEERLLREEMFDKESALKEKLAAEAATQRQELSELGFRLDLAKEFLMKGTEEGRKLGYRLAGPYAPILQQYFEGKAITPGAISPTTQEPLGGVTGPTVAPEAGVPTPTPAPTEGKVKIPQLIAKELKTPPEFAALEYGMNAVGMSPQDQAKVMGSYVKLMLQKKLADPAYQIAGKPFVLGGIWMANFKDGSSRPLTDAKGQVIPKIDIQGGAETGWWAINQYRAQQGAKNAVQMVIQPADRSDPLSVRMKGLEDAINLWVPQAETFKFGSEGKAMIPRGIWGERQLPWGPPDKQGNIRLVNIEDVIYDLGHQYYVDLKVVYDEKDKHFKVAFLKDLAPKYEGIGQPQAGEGRFKQEPPKPMPRDVAVTMRKKCLEAAKGDETKAEELFIRWAEKSGYNWRKME